MKFPEDKKVGGTWFTQLRVILKTQFTNLFTLQNGIAKFMGLIFLKLLHQLQGWSPLQF